MTDPITPPPQLMCEWINKSLGSNLSLNATIGMISYNEVATQAANWGADQELEACCEWLKNDGCHTTAIELGRARRPKPKSLAEEALEEVGTFEGMGTCNIDIIRRALERLQELEGQGDD